jgi:hypothetical protein
MFPGHKSCDGETASCAFCESQLRDGLRAKGVTGPWRRGLFPGHESCDRKTASCAFCESLLRDGMPKKGIARLRIKEQRAAS